MSVMPWPATRWRRQQLRLAGLERLHGRLAGGDRVAAEQVQRVGEALDEPLLHLAVAGEDDERLVRGEEVLDPGQRGAALAARRRAGAAR